MLCIGINKIKIYFDTSQLCCGVVHFGFRCQFSCFRADAEFSNQVRSSSINVDFVCSQSQRKPPKSTEKGGFLGCNLLSGCF
jgi:hypothetical protein